MHTIPIVAMEQVLVLRRIYNENREALATVPLPERTEEEQRDWWCLLDHSRVRLWLHFEGEEVIGFSMLTDRGGFETPMFAIAKEHQRKGYARAFIEHYLQKATSPLAGSQLVSNERICRLNAMYGWQVMWERGGVQYLYNDRKLRALVCAYHAERERS